MCKQVLHAQQDWYNHHLEPTMTSTSVSHCSVGAKEAESNPSRSCMRSKWGNRSSPAQPGSCHPAGERQGTCTVQEHSSPSDKVNEMESLCLPHRRSWWLFCSQAGAI